jgi:hypothetical protein
MQHQLLHHIKFVIQTNALKPALAGMNPKSFPVASPEMHQLHLQKICKSSSQS